MLILTRKPGESIYIGDGIKVIIVEVKGSQIRVGIEAPPEVRIYREEIYLQILEENKKAAEAANVSESGLEGLGGSLSGLAPSGSGGSSAHSLLATSPIKKPSEALAVTRKKGGRSTNE